MSNLVIQTNVLALNSHRNLKVIGQKQASASAKLSSGYRINSAADDAAGLAISEKMRSQIRGLDMASKNAQDAQSLIQTAEGGMNEIDNMVQRIRELVVYASNDTADQSSAINTQGDRQKMQDEIDQLLDEIDSMSGRVEFNKKTLINGTYSTAGRLNADGITAITGTASLLSDAKVNLDNAITAAGNDKTAIQNLLDLVKQQVSNQPGLNPLGTNVIKFTADVKALQGYLDGITVDGNLLASDVTTATIPASTPGDVKAVADLLAADIAAFVITPAAGDVSDGVDGNTTDGLGQTLKTLTDALSTKAGDFLTTGAAIEPLAQKVAVAQANYDVARINPDNRTPGTTLYFQVGANANQGLQLNIGSVDTASLGLASGAGASGKVVDVMKTTGLFTTDLLNTLDNALTIVTTERSKLGAASNRLDYTMSSLDISSENLSDAESRIRDTDMGKEMMNLTAANILQQAGISMLAQANQSPQSVLQLLR